MSEDHPLAGETVKICHKTGTLRENPADPGSYQVELELGGVVQNILVAESYAETHLEGDHDGA